MLLTWKLRPMEGKGQPKARALDMVEPGGNLCCLPHKEEELSAGAELPVEVGGL